MKIYFMRHGESESNAGGTFTGQWDVPLTALGVEQARTAGEKLRGINFDKIYSSDLKRARATCEAALPGCEYTTDARLREIDVGSLAGISYRKCLETYGDKVEKCRASGNYSSFGGETREQFWGRIRTFLDELAGKPYERVALFVHAGLMRAVFNMTFDTLCLGKISNSNCVIAVFDLQSDGKLSLDAWNI